MTDSVLRTTFPYMGLPNRGFESVPHGNYSITVDNGNNGNNGNGNNGNGNGNNGNNGNGNGNNGNN